jgi:Fic family protein
MIVSKKLYDRIREKKKKMDSLRPFNKFQLRTIKEQMNIEYIYNSTSIEGNTLTLNETRMVLQEGVTIGGKSLREHLDVTNQKEALAQIEEFIKKRKREIKVPDILILHKITLKGISDYWAGRYKTSQNRIIGSKLKTTPPYKVPDEMQNLIYLINKNPDKYNIVDLAAVAHHELVRIHPFIDGNGRCARLLTNLLLMRAGYPPIIIKNKDRKKYFNALEKAHFGDLEPFVNFIAQAIDSALIMYLSALTPTTEETELLPLKELAKKTPYSQEYLSLLARRGIISAVKIGGIWNSTREEIKNYLKSVKK